MLAIIEHSSGAERHLQLQILPLARFGLAWEPLRLKLGALWVTNGYRAHGLRNSSPELQDSVGCLSIYCEKFVCTWPIYGHKRGQVGHIVAKTSTATEVGCECYTVSFLPGLAWSNKFVQRVERASQRQVNGLL